MNLEKFNILLVIHDDMILVLLYFPQNMEFISVYIPQGWGPQKEFVGIWQFERLPFERTKFPWMSLRVTG